MDMRMRDGNPTRFKGKLILGASDFGINFDTPVSKNGKTTLLASYRRSYLQMLFSVLGLPFLPTYNDYQFKLTSKLGASDEFYLIGLGSFDYNRLNTGLKDPDDDQKYILGYLPENRQSSYVFGAGYVHRFRAGQLRVVVSRNAFTNKLYKHERNDKSLPRTIEYRAIGQPGAGRNRIAVGRRLPLYGRRRRRQRALRQYDPAADLHRRPAPHGTVRQPALVRTLRTVRHAEPGIFQGTLFSAARATGRRNDLPPKCTTRCGNFRRG